MTRKRNLIKSTSLLALFLALAVLLNFVEHYLPVLVSIPGVKLGLANTMGLIVLYFFSKKEYAGLGFFRVLIVSLLFSGLFSSAFFLSFSGWLLSTIVCIMLVKTKKLSIYSLSVASAIFHGVGQILCACIIYKSIYMLTYLPILLFSGIITGILIAFVSSLVIERIAPYISKILGKNYTIIKNNQKSIKKENKIKVNITITKK